MMTLRAHFDGKVIVLDEPADLATGTRVEVAVVQEQAPRKSSPKALLRLTGTLSHEEAESLRQATAQMRRIDPGLWTK